MLERLKHFEGADQVALLAAELFRPTAGSHPPGDRRLTLTDAFFG